MSGIFAFANGANVLRTANLLFLKYNLPLLILNIGALQYSQWEHWITKFTGLSKFAEDNWGLGTYTKYNHSMQLFMSEKKIHMPMMRTLYSFWVFLS